MLHTFAFHQNGIMAVVSWSRLISSKFYSTNLISLLKTSIIQLRMFVFSFSVLVTDVTSIPHKVHRALQNEVEIWKLTNEKKDDNTYRTIKGRHFWNLISYVIFWNWNHCYTIHLGTAKWKVLNDEIKFHI